jgi:hypothetical protein
MRDQNSINSGGKIEIQRLPNPSVFCDPRPGLTLRQACAEKGVRLDPDFEVRLNFIPTQDLDQEVKAEDVISLYHEDKNAVEGLSAGA